ncbi:N-acetyltransferase esco2 [Podila epicladia]|nr:N-acetyltransferase esco2 [Podila epicladia]KAG0087080.1 N-acetyltransferase esco2 [Podila epicladia]
MSNSSTDSGLGQSPETPTRVYKFHKPVKNTYGRARPSTDPPSSPDPWSTSRLATTPTRSSSSNNSSSPVRRSRLSGSFQDNFQEPWTPTTKGTRALTDKLASANLEVEDAGSSCNEDQENTDKPLSGLHIGLDSPMKRKRQLVAGEVTPLRQSPRRRLQQPQQDILDSDNDDEDSAKSQRSTRSSPTPPSSPSQRTKRTKVVLPLTPSSSSSSNGSAATTEKKIQQATLSSFFTTSASKGTGILKGRTTVKLGTVPPENDCKKPAEPVKKLEQLFLAFSKDRTKSSAAGSLSTRTGGLSRESERSQRYHCPQCGMPYVRGQPEDEQIHERYHRVTVGGIDYPGYKNEVVVARFSDQELEQSVIPVSSTSSSHYHSASTGLLGESRIVVVSMTDGGSIFEKKKVREVLELVNKELGSVEFDPETLEGCKVFLYISGKKKVVGCVVAERIKEGFEIMSSSSSTTSATGESVTLETVSNPGFDPADKAATKDRSTRVHHSSAIFCSTVPQPAVCGINRIWVSTLYRRQKVASRLLDAVRDRFIYACKLERKDLAFSQPTGDGKALARQYLGTNKFLVYVE